MEIPLTVRDLEPDDLGDLAWSGGSEHLRAVSDAWQATFEGQVVVLVVTLPTGRLIGCGAVDFRDSPDGGRLWMLSVHETFQSLGVGTVLVGALEQRILDHGRTSARLSVEHDNPRAARWYRRLGYRDVGTAVESWPAAGGVTYVTAVTAMARNLTVVGATGC